MQADSAVLVNWCSDSAEVSKSLQMA